MRTVLTSWLVVVGVGCGDETPARDADAAVDGDGVSTADAAVPDDGAEVSEPPLTPEERGFREVRAIVHLHSAFSHDGCDDAGLDADGKPNMTCVRRMKRALCEGRIGVAFMTDHPGHMRDHAFEELLYAEDGDTIGRDENGIAQSVVFACDDASEGVDGKVVLFVGFEGTHTMGIGLAQHLEPRERYSISFEDETASADLDLVTAAVREAGGIVTIAHSEEPELSAETIVGHDVTGMELYNFHANFNVVLGTDLGDKLFQLEDFVGTEDVVDPDLTALVMFDRYPEEALFKWREVSARRRITAFAGSDVHENVKLPAFCATEGICDELAKDYPNLVARLVSGGAVVQSDGERLDGYARVFGWVQNRVLVPGAGDGGDVGAGVRQAFEAGANRVVFEVLGDASGVALVARAKKDKTLYDMGAVVGAADMQGGLELWARSPDLPLPGRRAAWTDGSAAAIEAVLWRSTAAGTNEVLRWSEPGAWKSVELDAEDVGSYHLEVFVTPHHLSEALGPAERLAHGTYRWVETNAIIVEAP